MNPHNDSGQPVCGCLHSDSRRITAVFDGIVEEIAEDHFQQQAAGVERNGRDVKFKDIGNFVLVMQAGGTGALSQQIFAGDSFGFGALAGLLPLPVSWLPVTKRAAHAQHGQAANDDPHAATVELPEIAVTYEVPLLWPALEFVIKSGRRTILVCFSGKPLSKCTRKMANFGKCCGIGAGRPDPEFPLYTLPPFCPAPKI
ncbi:MAG: hypothetical protein ACKON9_06580 [Planctomycetaceae bacterium]